MRFVIPALTTVFLVVAGTASTASAAPQDAAPSAPASLPFPAGAKLAFVDLQRVLAESTEGQAANARVQELTDQKVQEIQNRDATLQAQIGAKNQQLQESQEKLAQGETVMSPEARLSLSREISRLQLEVQRDTQDAQAEMQRVTQDAEAELAELNQQLQMEFDAKLTPAVEAVAMEFGVDFIFNAGQGGIVWANRSLDLTQAVIDRLNATVP